MWKLISAAVCLVAITRASIPYGDIQSLDDLYRLQELYEMSQMRDPYLDVLGPIDDIEGRSIDDTQVSGYFRLTSFFLAILLRLVIS